MVMHEEFLDGNFSSFEDLRKANVEHRPHTAQVHSDTVYAQSILLFFNIIITGFYAGLFWVFQSLYDGYYSQTSSRNCSVPQCKMSSSASILASQTTFQFQVLKTLL